MARPVSMETPRGRISAWRADPHIPPKGALIVVQEIFGVNAHIKHQVDRFAAHGYIALAPCLFDHIERGVELAYDEEGIQRGRELAEQTGFDHAVEDIRAAQRLLEGEEAIVGVVGYCWGGTVAFLSNTRLSLPAVSYYGGRTVPFLHEHIQKPMLFHFGSDDSLITPEDVDQHRELQPLAEFHVWPAGHGFNCEERADYHEESARLALERTLSFFERTLKPHAGF
jgi:carboxymethylenebutenolidase